MTTSVAKTKTATSKKKPVQKLKNVLAFPFPQYWPELNPEQVAELEKYILDIKKGQGDNFTLTDDSILIGLSKVIRELNHYTPVYFLLSSDIKPKFIATQIINLTLSKYKQSKVLCVPNLKEFSKSLFGIESIAVGYREGQSPCVEKWIAQKQSEWFPIPDEILQYYGRTTSSNDDSNSKSVTLQEHPKCTKSVNLNSLYLTRIANQPKNKRVFVPKNAKESNPFECDEKPECSDFISFSGKTKSNVAQMEVDDDDNDETFKINVMETIKKLKAKSRNGDNRSNGLDDLQNFNLPTNQQKITKKQKLTHDFQTNSNYISLKVNKIQPNPNKIKSKKKK